MAKNKTTYTNEDVFSYLNTNVADQQKLQDSLTLIEWMKEITGCEASMWGPSIIGFGNYHYVYDSGHSGDAPLLGFSPRKAAISLYVFTGAAEHEHLIANLGKFKMGKACIYVKKLTDIDAEELKKLMKFTVDFLKEKYG